MSQHTPPSNRKTLGWAYAALTAFTALSIAIPTIIERWQSLQSRHAKRSRD